MDIYVKMDELLSSLSSEEKEVLACKLKLNSISDTPVKTHEEIKIANKRITEMVKQKLESMKTVESDTVLYCTERKNNEAK